MFFAASSLERRKMAISTKTGLQLVVFYMSAFLATLGTPWYPLQGASGDVVTVYAHKDTKGRLLQCLALPRAGHGLCERRKTTVSTNNGSHVCMGWYTTC